MVRGTDGTKYLNVPKTLVGATVSTGYGHLVLTVGDWDTPSLKRGYEYLMTVSVYFRSSKKTKTNKNKLSNPKRSHRIEGRGGRLWFLIGGTVQTPDLFGGIF